MSTRSSESIARCTVSFVFVLLTHSAFSLVPLFFSSSSILLQSFLAAMVLVISVGLGSRCRKLIGVTASAPAFVFFNVLFVWGVYLAVVRQAISRIVDVMFNGEVAMLLIGLSCIISSDPGWVALRPLASGEPAQSSDLGVESRNESSLLQWRVRYCKTCKAYIKGFDHHCPAFGNCIGQNNYVLFMVLLIGFLITEASYVVCSFHFARKFGILDRTRLETTLAGILAKSTLLFSLLQVLWQVVFLTWHLYCVCFNIRTDEWINWKKYPEFQHSIQCQPGESFDRIQFRNPYDKGIIQNLMEFLTYKG